MARKFNRVRVRVPTTGTGPLSLGAALAGFRGFYDAGAANGDTVSYLLEDGAAWEIGTGVLNASTLTRDVQESSNGNAPIDLSGNAILSVSLSAQDLADLVASVNGKTGVVTLDAADVGAAPAEHGHQIGDVGGLAGELQEIRSDIAGLAAGGGGGGGISETNRPSVPENFDWNAPPITRGRYKIDSTSVGVRNWPVELGTEYCILDVVGYAANRVAYIARGMGRNGSGLEIVRIYTEVDGTDQWKTVQVTATRDWVRDQVSPSGLLAALDALAEDETEGSAFASLVADAVANSPEEIHPLVARRGFLTQSPRRPELDEDPANVGEGEEHAVYAVGKPGGGVFYTLRAVVRWTVATARQIVRGDSTSDQLAVTPAGLHDAFTWHALPGTDGVLEISGERQVDGSDAPVVRGTYTLTGNAVVALAVQHRLDPVATYRRRFVNASASQIRVTWTGADFRPEENMPSSGSEGGFTLQPGEILTLNFELIGDDVAISRGGLVR